MKQDLWRLRLVGNLEKEIFADRVVLAVGRSGSNWLENLCRMHNIKYSYGVADIGIRYELPDKVMQDINTNLLASSDNTNLAILVSVRAGNTNDFAHSIGKTINQLVGGPVIQRFEDFKLMRSTKQDALKNNPVHPTLDSAKPSDISLGMPKRIVEAIIEFIEKMDIVVPGFADPYNYF